MKFKIITFTASIICFISMPLCIDVHMDKVNIHTVGTIKMRSYSESRGVHTGGVQNQQKSLEEF
jgi:hypothetical protein